MNPQTHRVILNKSRGCMMAVSEVASSTGKGSTAKSRSRKSRAKRCKSHDLPVSSAQKPNLAYFYPSNNPLAQWIYARAAHNSIAFSINTTLIGGLITSTQQAVDAKLNSFTTTSKGGQLTTTDLQNTAAYTATASSSTIGVVTELTKSGGGVGNKQGNASSTSASGISGKAGNKAARTGDANTGIKPIFNADTVRADVNAQVAIMTSFTQQAAKAIGDYGAAKLKEATDKGDLAEIAKWREGGSSRVALHAALDLLVKCGCKLTNNVNITAAANTG